MKIRAVNEGDQTKNRKMGVVCGDVIGWGSSFISEGAGG
jgi:hypothetical protein